MGHRYSSGNVGHIVLAQQPGGESLPAAIRCLHPKGGSLLAVFQVTGTVGIALLKTVGDGSLIHFVLPHKLVVAVYKPGSALGQRVEQLPLGPHDIVQRLKGFQMLIAKGCDHTDLRVHDIADLLYISHMPGPHLTQKYLMGGPQAPPNGLYNTHGGVKALRRLQHIILRAQQTFEIIFDTGLAVAAGDTDDLQVRAGFQHSPGISDIVPVDALFHGHIDQICQQDHIGAKHGSRHRQH